ncbi:MAG: right-handed parallel beta-helix repeat-containing protein [Phycisphaerales bacterium]|nr:right-handed parallel beta-helix repeat-containing protein [Phycisphaerales bacterium]
MERKWSKRMGSSFAVFAAAGMAFGQATIRVPADAPTIGAAVALAESGDTVLVAPGVYAERVEILGKAIRLVGEGGAAETVIDAGGGGFALRIHGNAEVVGFTITGAANSPSTNDGTGLAVTGGAPVIRDSVVSGNRGLEGGGVRVRHASVTLERVTIEANQAPVGGGLHAWASNVTLRDVRIQDHNTPSNGGGLFVVGGSVTADGLELSRNISGTNGGGGYIVSADLDISRLNAVENGEATVNIDGNVTYNTQAGGGLFLSSVTGRIDRSRFVQNHGFAGGALYISGSSPIEIVNTLVTGSLCSQGAILVNNSEPLIVNCTVVDNNQWGVFARMGLGPTVRNSIFSGNEIGPSSLEICGQGQIDVAWTLINGTAIASLGDGLIFADPMLDADFAPLPGSPAIDAGNNEEVPSGVTVDLLGGDRFVDDPDTTNTGVGTGAIVDLGAIEFSPLDACPADMHGDGSVHAGDFFMFLDYFVAGHERADFNKDGAIDAADFFDYLTAFADGC